MSRATLLIALGTAVLLPAQPPPFSAGPVSARVGEMSSGYIGVPAGADPGSRIPVTVIQGARPGPVLALLAGNHGYEYTPILALQQLRSRIDPKRLAGKLVLVHVANMPSYLARTIYFSPVDRKNLNRVYPGRRDGTVSERIAHAITTEVIDKCDYLLDLHAGDGNESLRPYVYQAVTGRPKMDAELSEMALAFGLDHIVLDRQRPTDPAASIYCSTTAVTRNKPAMTVECGFLGVPDQPSAMRIVRGVENLMRHLKMLEGAAERVRAPVYFDPAEVLTSPATGILHAHVERGQWVAKGARLAHVTDFFGTTIGEVQAPFSGVVLYVVATPPISQGEPVAFVGAVK
ncbi:MAG: succinylglutamate desuccinylase/aspartoacylase family protein [Candidatus Solibacter usitatus]|nr:succinylglutamate desuccinylase/aspartoacylase family protein [Candidatus Solibacter usitatus]